MEDRGEGKVEARRFPFPLFHFPLAPETRRHGITDGQEDAPTLPRKGGGGSKGEGVGSGVVEDQRPELDALTQGSVRRRGGIGEGAVRGEAGAAIGA